MATLPENMPAAISSKAVDATSILDPFARIGETQLGKDGLTFLDTDISSYYVMSIKQQIATANYKSITCIKKSHKGKDIL